MKITKKMWRDVSDSLQGISDWQSKTEERLDALEAELKQMKCSHDYGKEFICEEKASGYENYHYIYSNYYKQTCAACGKVMADYGKDECAWLKDKAAHLAKLAKECEKEKS